jgi:hypothetical protein
MKTLATAALVLGLFAGSAFAQNGPSLAPQPTAAPFAGTPNWFYNSYTPTGTASASYVMMGLGAQNSLDNATVAALTPRKTGAFLVTIEGSWENSVSGDGCQIEPGWGIGSAPVNGAAVPAAFTPATTAMAWTALAASAPLPFSRTFIFQDTVSTPVYVDLAVQAVTGGTCTLPHVDVSFSEL